MSDYILTTESSCDLPDSFLFEESLRIVPLYYTFDDITIYGDEENLPITEFYLRMRNDEIPKTMASNLERILDIFRSILTTGKDIIHVGFSGALSSSFNNVILAKNILSEEFPERKITVVDSLLASLGQGYLLSETMKKSNQGYSYEELVQWLQENRMRVCADFTVEDLKYLRNGGRISRTTALVGSLMNIKPILHMDEQGRLVAMNNVRGRKKALNTLVERCVENIEKDCSTVFISHGDCEEDAHYVGDMLKQKLSITDILYHYVGTAIGAHSGPGTIAVFYYGKCK